MKQFFTGIEAVTQTTINFDRPFQPASATSRAAAKAQPDSKLLSDRKRIEVYVREQGEHGATRWEIAQALKPMPYSTVCARVKPMVDKGVLIETERTRLTGNDTPAYVLVAPIT